jgi:predicted AAA+ superfamily ATPase
MAPCIRMKRYDDQWRMEMHFRKKLVEIKVLMKYSRSIVIKGQMQSGRTSLWTTALHRRRYVHYAVSDDRNKAVFVSSSDNLHYPNEIKEKADWTRIHASHWVALVLTNITLNIDENTHVPDIFPPSVEFKNIILVCRL